MNEIRYRLFWTQPCRRWMIRLSRRLPDFMERWFDNQLYPDDCTVTFREEPS